VLSDDTHPLGKIKSDYAFVDTVIWSTGERRQKIEDTVTAAMQPLRAVIDARVATLGRQPSSTSAAR
jgi:hypothetical protein